MAFERITVDATPISGVPWIRGPHIPEATVIEVVAGGIASCEIPCAYLDLEQVV